MPPAGCIVAGCRLSADGAALDCYWAGETASPAGIAPGEPGAMQRLQAHEFSQNTLKNYRAQWRRFCDWAQARGVRPLPADPEQIGAYLAERIERQGHKPATIRAAAAAIAFVHRAADRPNPCQSEAVRRTLRGAGRKLGRAQQQARPLTEEALARIRLHAQRPRRSRGGRWERPETAMRRASLDLALIRLMRDAMLRVSEAADLTWADIERAADGSGRVLIRRAKTDPDGKGSVVYCSPETMAALERIRPPAADEAGGRLFGLRANQLARRIGRAAEAAGLGPGFSGHSPRVGMAQDLAQAGIELPGLMTAGRWRSAAMPAHYTRNEAAARGAVAQYYRLRAGRARG